VYPALKKPGRIFTPRGSFGWCETGTMHTQKQQQMYLRKYNVTLNQREV